MRTNSELILRMLLCAKYKIAPMGPQNDQQDLERGSILNYWALQTTFAK